MHEPAVDGQEWLELAALGTATIHEASSSVHVLSSDIKPVTGVKVCGPAYPVRCPPGDNLRLHAALREAVADTVIVADVAGAHDFGYWGEVMTRAAIVRKLAGVVIDGCVRDVERLRALGLPVFARGASIRGTGKDPLAPGTLNRTINVGGSSISPGDIVVGDCDGVTVIPRAAVGEVLASARRRHEWEEQIIGRIAAGETTMAVYQLAEPDT